MSYPLYHGHFATPVNCARGLCMTPYAVNIHTSMINMEVGNTEHLFASFSGMIALPVYLQMLDQFSKSFLSLAPLGIEALWRNSDLGTNYAWLNSKKNKNYRFSKTCTFERVTFGPVSLLYVLYVYYPDLQQCGRGRRPLMLCTC